MTNQELKRKLLEWAGFVWHNYEVYESEHKDTRIEDPYWENPKGRRVIVPPDFPSSLDACFRWLIEDDWYVLFWKEATGYGASIDQDPNQTGDEYRGFGETRAIALCNAIKEKIDNE